MPLSSNEQQKSCRNAKIFYISNDQHAKDKQYVKLRIIVIIQLNIHVSHIECVIYRIVHLKKFYSFSQWI